MTLKELQIGKEAVVREVSGTGPLRLRLLDMGIIPGTRVKIQKIAPLGDPIQIQIRGYELTLRLDDAALIRVESREEAGVK